MRSMRSEVGQEALPLGLPAPEPRRARRRKADDRPEATRLVHRLGSDALASRGMPAGTEVLVDTTLPPRRGQVLFVRIAGRLRVGVFEVELGRAVLRSDRATIWLDHTVEVWGVARVIDPPLDGMPLE